MTGTKRQPEYPIPEEGSTAKRQRVVEPPVVATGSDLSRMAVRPGDFASLPTELQLAVAQEVANLPNRREALEGLTNLMRANKHVNSLILGAEDLQQSIRSLQRHSGVESRYVAVCHDVAGGMSVSDALAQNGPLPKADERLHAADVNDALEQATPEHLASLADAFSARTDPASKEALTGVAWAATSQGHDLAPALETANIHNLATLAGAFARNNLALEDGRVAMAVEAVAQEVAGRDELLPQANIQQIATLAGAFSRHNFNDAIEAVAAQVFARRHDLLPRANVEQIAMLASAMATCPDDTADDCLDLLVWQVTERRDDLLPDATAEHLAMLHTAFELAEGYAEGYEDRLKASAAVAEEIAKRDTARLPPHDTQPRPQLDNRDRSVERTRA